MAKRVQLLVPLALLVACGTQNANPQVLRLAGGGTAKEAALAPTSSGSNGDYTVVGTLPSGKPEDAAAWTLAKGAADHDTVAALEKALHTTTLQVSTRAGQSWYWSPCAPDTAVSSSSSDGGTVSSCAIATDAGSGSGVATPTSPVPGASYSPPPTPPDVPASTVRTAVEPVFAALGISLHDVTIETSPYGGSASYDPTVGGLRTIGLTTRVDVTQQGKLSSASGWLGSADAADLYPLITAKQAFDALPIAPRMELCRVGPDGQGCLQPAPQEITGAHVGLLAQPLQDEGTILVPAWLFDVKGGTQPIAQIAVEGKYLGAPTPEPVNTASDQPAPPPAVTDPVAPSTTAISIDAAFKGTKPNEVVVQYGDSGSCPHTHVTHDVKEDATTVYVVLQADAMKPDVVCTEDYRPVKVTITLQAPLGDRKVVDANGSREVPVT